MISKKSFTISVLILIASIAPIAAISQRSEPRVVATNLENLPVEIDGFKAIEQFFDQSIYDELNADRHVYRYYRNPSGDRVVLYIGYYGTAKGGRTPHNPYACLPSSGWGIVKTEQIKLAAPYLENGVSINYILAQKGDTYESVLHWYQSAKNKVLNSGLKRNIQRFIGRVFHNRNDGAFVRVSALTSKEGIEKANQKIKNFSEELLTLLPQHWPEEK